MTADPRPPLLLLPGTSCDRRIFAPVIDRFGDCPTVFGNMSGAQSMPDQAEAILAVTPPTFLSADFSFGGILRA